MSKTIKNIIAVRPFLCLLLGLFIFSEAAFALELKVDRRRKQFHDDFSYGILPIPFSVPGIGSGLSVAAAATNIYDSYFDIGTIKTVAGDVDLFSVLAGDLFLIPETLFLDLAYNDFGTVASNFYKTRGMNSEKDDYNVMEVADAKFNWGRATLTFDQRRVELFASYSEMLMQVEKVRNPDGDIIAEVENPEQTRNINMKVGFRYDNTDDFLDPRVGVRLELVYNSSPAEKADQPEYYIFDRNLQGYIPVGNRSTVVLNYFQSSAIVRNEGETDKTKIQEQLDFNCSEIADASQRATCEIAQSEIVNATYAGNKYGSATDLGGQNRMRSYPQGRFIGGQSASYGVEFRWNFAEETVPFNIYILRDVRTTLQGTLFYEVGSVSETLDELWDERRASYGFGFRMTAGSGLVYRFDYGIGDEGSEVTLIFGYPWSVI